MKSDYHERQERRRDGLQNAANKRRALSEELHDEAHRMAQTIPFGQPILVGHHSEKADRNFRKRMQDKCIKASGLYFEAKEYDRRAAAVGTAGISSDNPDAIALLTEKIREAEERQEFMKAANKLLKRKAGPDREGLYALGLSDSTINRLLLPDFAGRIGFPSYAITNNNANIRRMRDRLEVLKRNEAAEYTEETINGVKVVQDPTENRTQLYFPGIPKQETRAYLKGHGFRWARSLGCWQRHMSNGALYHARRAAEMER